MNQPTITIGDTDSQEKVDHDVHRAFNLPTHVCFWVDGAWYSVLTCVDNVKEVGRGDHGTQNHGEFSVVIHTVKAEVNTDPTALTGWHSISPDDTPESFQLKLFKSAFAGLVAKVEARDSMVQAMVERMLTGLDS